MTDMRMLSLAVLCCLALAACNREPTFDASSLPAYQKSLSAVEARLNAQDKRKLQVALMTLAAGDAADYTAFAMANPDTVAQLEMLNGIANPLSFLDRMRPGIDGRTAAAVIGHVADDLDFAITRAERQGDSGERLLDAFVVENARYSWDSSRYGQPTLEFSVYNGSRKSISTIYLTGTLTTADLAAPLTMADFSYRFERSLPPGVQQDVRVTLQRPGPWTAKQLATAYDRDFKLKVSNVGDQNGKRLLLFNVGWLDVMRKKRDLLRGN